MPFQICLFFVCLQRLPSIALFYDKHIDGRSFSLIQMEEIGYVVRLFRLPVIIDCYQNAQRVWIYIYIYRYISNKSKSLERWWCAFWVCLNARHVSPLLPVSSRINRCDLKRDLKFKKSGCIVRILTEWYSLSRLLRLALPGPSHKSTILILY